ncbi:MAG: hypothetical protein IPK12_03085 [Gemmatimonadetes bacterium]|nr:hypothetical protein [Gemmatimonadota bacterium]
MTSDQDDLEVRRRLQADYPIPPLAPEAFERLAFRIRAEAAPVLAQHARRDEWNRQVVRAGRVLAPLALAAGLAGLLLMSRAAESATGSLQTVAEATPGSTFLAALRGEATTDGLLDVTLGSTGGEWMLAAGSK